MGIIDSYHVEVIMECLDELCRGYSSTVSYCTAKTCTIISYTRCHHNQSQMVMERLRLAKEGRGLAECSATTL